VDAVISVLGPTKNTADQVALFESFARSLVEAMSTHGVRRLVAISGGACTLPGERKRLGARVASTFVRLAVRHVVAAKQRELEIIAASDLDWTAPRPPRVVEKPALGKYRVGDDASGMSITQADLAAFMVDQLTDTTYLRQAPFVSN
jgi:putative NADH-flavin reductase